MVTNALESLKNIKSIIEDKKKISDKYIININNYIAIMANNFNLTVKEIQSEFKIKRISKKREYLFIKNILLLPMLPLKNVYN